MAGINFTGGTGLDGRPPTDWDVWMDDFHFYLATDWVITETGSGTRAISQAKNGVLLITNAAADDDVNQLQARDVASGQVAEHWTYVAAKQFYFGCRIKVSDMTQSDWQIGVQVTDTSPIASAPADGMYFKKDDGDAYLDAIVSNTSVSTGSPTAMATLSDDTWYVLEFAYNGDGNFAFFVDGVQVGGVDNDYAPTTELAISFAIQNGAGAAKSMSIDWIKVAQER